MGAMKPVRAVLGVHLHLSVVFAVFVINTLGVFFKSVNTFRS
jgi:hypothetical protein